MVSSNPNIISARFVGAAVVAMLSLHSLVMPVVAEQVIVRINGTPQRLQPYLFGVF